MHNTESIAMFIKGKFIYFPLGQFQLTFCLASVHATFLITAHINIVLECPECNLF